MLTHIGRNSGRTYHTPIKVFRPGEHYVFALTYGSNVQWLKNIFAAGSVEMRTRGRDIHLVEPELIVNPELRLMPLPLRIAGKLNRVSELVHASHVTAQAVTPRRAAA